MRRRRALVLVAIVAGIFVAAVLAEYALKPRWEGEGDWAACARVAGVPPGDAAEAVARREGVNLWDYRAHVGPAFVNATGVLSDIVCRERIVTSPTGVRLPSGTSDGEDHYAWRVSLNEEWGLRSTPETYLDWDTGACVFRYGGC